MKIMLLSLLFFCSDVDGAIEKAKKDVLGEPKVIVIIREVPVYKEKVREDPYRKRLLLRLSECEVELAECRAKGYREDYVTVSTLKEKIKQLKKVLNESARSHPDRSRGRSDR